MKLFKAITATTLLAAYLAAPVIGFAAEGKAEKTDKKAKPYTLDKCIVSDEKLDADADMKPFVFTHGGQEFKLCCKSCKKDFDKDPAKYVAKLAKAEKNKKK
jgi:YHS domain-containing protein